HRQVSSHLPSHAEPTLPSRAVLTLSNLTASTHSSPAGIPLLTVLPTMAITILSVWAAHCAPEASSVHESTPEASPVHESAPEASPVHESTPEASPVHESAPEASPVLLASTCPVLAKKANPILSTGPATFKGATPEVSALPWGFLLSSALLWWSSASLWRSSDSSVPSWGSLLLSALLYWLPAPPGLPALPAPPWLQAHQDLTWWTSHPVFHCLPLRQGPGPTVLHCLSLLHDPCPPPLHGPGPPSHPLVYLVPTTLQDCCFLSARSRS
ncbi:hypothetical protein M9458_040037, partial [Cirrhinus mrigala]